jgi:hypothetical protein
MFLAVAVSPVLSAGAGSSKPRSGKTLFEKETFGGNGRTCRTCHSADTGTVSPKDAAKRFKKDPDDPLFLHDGSDDGLGNGVSRILADATILVTIPLPTNVTLAGDPGARTVTLRRGIPTTINTPALDPVLMHDGRQPTLQAQGAGAILDHAHGVLPSVAELNNLAEFQKTSNFFSSSDLKKLAKNGKVPELPKGKSSSEKRGRRFFIDSVPDPTFKTGLCAQCHSGPMLNQTNQFVPDFTGLAIPAGTRFQNILVSEFNLALNPVREYIFNQGTPDERHLFSPDPGRVLITGNLNVSTNDHVNAFKIPTLWDIRHTAPYFHDNSAKTLEDVAAHYANFFDATTGGSVFLTPQDRADIVAYMKLLD